MWNERYFAKTLPGLTFSRIPFSQQEIFPFNRADSQYFYNSRSAIYTLAQVMGLQHKEVLFPDYCCGVDLEALLSADVVPKFYNVSGNMEVKAETIISKIGPLTKAIYLIHYLGFPGPVNELLDVCKKKNIYLIEDCALSLFSSIKEGPLGSFGHGSVFSVYKSLPVPSGGVLVFNNYSSVEIPDRKNPPVISTVKHIADSLERNNNDLLMKCLGKSLRVANVFLKLASRNKPAKSMNLLNGDFDPNVAKYKMSRMSKWIIDSINLKNVVNSHRSNYEFLQRKLKGHVKAVFDHLPEGVCPLFFAFFVQDNKEVTKELRKRGIEAWPWWWWSHPFLKDHESEEVVDLRRRVVVVPCHENLSKAALERIANEVAGLSDAYKSCFDV